MSVNIVYKQKDGIDVVEIDNEIGLLNIDTGEYFVFNEVGSMIWRMLSNEKSLEELINDLRLEYNVDFSIAYSETNEFITNLKKSGLVIERSI